MHSWAINEINIYPTPNTEWKSPKTGLRYAMQHRIPLTSEDYPVDIMITMVRDDQEIVIDTAKIKYEGLGLVEGMLGGQHVAGQAFVEIQPAGELK
ncbi:MAG: hypothetical protein H8E51_02220 [Bacteroidetes bacterium]|nr:hypothetical protein [Bacteroidota bacterium]